jgi:hypothetical protein
MDVASINIITDKAEAIEFCEIVELLGLKNEGDN